MIRFVAMCLLSIGLAVAIGCATDTSGPASADKFIKDNPIMKVVQLYGSYESTNGRPPESMDQLRAWAKKQPKEKLDAMGITDVDAATTSPRDNQPYRITPPAAGTPGGRSRVVIYEAVGVGGKRQTASNMGTSAEMTDEQIRAYVPKL